MTVVFVQDTFTWVCPLCQRKMYGRLADSPVSGWEEPRWVKSGTEDDPSLIPSLGCSGFRTGECSGHFFLREGKLVPA